jgi:allene oxide cyclase
MRTMLRTALVAALVGGVIGGLSLASASASRDRHVRTMTLIEVSTGQQIVDLGKKGFSLGGELMFTSRLQTLGGKRVGHTSVVCIAVLGEKIDCNGTGWLPGGTVRVGATLADTPTSVLAVVGGTGRYQGVGGQVVTRPVSDTRSRTRLRLIFPN